MAHAHGHLRSGSAGEWKALRRSLVLTAAVFVAEVAGGLASGSLALLSDAGHMATDMLALALSATAVRVAARPADPRRTFGYYRFEILAALVSGALLMFLALVILREGVERLSAPVSVRTSILLPVAGIGLATNAISFWWLRSARGGLATRAALWHAAADGLSSVLVLIAGAVMAFTRQWWIDPAVSLVVSGIIAWGAFRLLRESVDVLLESVPPGLDLDSVRDALLAIDAVTGVHDLHVWCLTSDVHALAGHLRVDRGRLGETDRVLSEAGRLLGERFGIRHTTLQVESDPCADPPCALDGMAGSEAPPANGESLR